jgi:hypothetical protein
VPLPQRQSKSAIRANPAKVEDFGGARDQEKWRPVFRPITRQLGFSITFITSDRIDLKILIGEMIPLRRDAR